MKPQFGQCIRNREQPITLKFPGAGPSLVVQWLRFCIASGGALVQSLVTKLDPT